MEVTKSTDTLEADENCSEPRKENAMFSFRPRKHSWQRGLLLALFLAGASLLACGPALAQNPYQQPDRSWITVSGTVQEVRLHAFTLDYGKGAIIVEMDDEDRQAQTYPLQPGDQVTVQGRIDDDLFETTTIEAESVFVEKLGATFFASARDEETYFWPSILPAIPPGITLTGTVSRVGREDFTLNTDQHSVRVSTENMAYNPLDDEGWQRIEVGDFVTVQGTFDDDLFERREFEAQIINKLVVNKGE